MYWSVRVSSLFLFSRSFIVRLVTTKHKADLNVDWMSPVIHTWVVFCPFIVVNMTMPFCQINRISFDPKDVDFICQIRSRNTFKHRRNNWHKLQKCLFVTEPFKLFLRFEANFLFWISYVDLVVWSWYVFLDLRV